MLSILGRLELCQNFKAFLQAHKTVTAQVLVQMVHGLLGEGCHWSMRVVCVRDHVCAYDHGNECTRGACACVCMFMCVCSLCTCACVCIWSPEDNLRCSSGIFCDRVSHWLAACRGRLSLLAIGPRDMSPLPRCWGHRREPPHLSLPAGLLPSNLLHFVM